MVALELVREDEDEGAHRCDASELSTSPRGEAEAAKARGNESFARGEFERAREAYTEALAHVGAEERTTRGPDGSFVDRSSVDADDGGRADVDADRGDGVRGEGAEGKRVGVEHARERFG